MGPFNQPFELPSKRKYDILQLSIVNWEGDGAEDGSWLSHLPLQEFPLTFFLNVELKYQVGGGKAWGRKEWARGQRRNRGGIELIRGCQLEGGSCSLDITKKTHNAKVANHHYRVFTSFCFGL